MEHLEQPSRLGASFDLDDAIVDAKRRLDDLYVLKHARLEFDGDPGSPLSSDVRHTEIVLKAGSFVGDASAFRFTEVSDDVLDTAASLASLEPASPGPF